VNTSSPMSTCFIADLHLSRNRPEALQRFLDFLQQEAPKHQTLYILGDLFDAWLGDDISIPEHASILDRLQQTSAHGVTIRIQPGNHDFLYRAAFEERSGCQLIPDPYLITLDGAPVLLTHGDQLCTEDRQYQRYRSVIRHPLTEWILLHLSRSLRRKLGRKLGQRSAHDKHHKSSAIMDVTPSAVDTLMRQHGVLQLIHGHTHRPATHTFQLDQAEATRIVLGEWEAEKSMLIYRSGSFLSAP